MEETGKKHWFSPGKNNINLVKCFIPVIKSFFWENQEFSFRQIFSVSLCARKICRSDSLCLLNSFRRYVFDVMRHLSFPSSFFPLDSMQQFHFFLTYLLLISIARKVSRGRTKKRTNLRDGERYISHGVASIRLSLWWPDPSRGSFSQMSLFLFWLFGHSKFSLYWYFGLQLPDMRWCSKVWINLSTTFACWCSTRRSKSIKLI